MRDKRAIIQRYAFGDFALDIATRELRRAGAILNVSPKLFDCLVYLIEHRDRAVGQDELIAAVWGDVNVAEVQLRHLVRKVRYVVDVRGAHHSAIRTIPRFGYHWVAELRNDGSPKAESATAVAGTRAQQDRPRGAFRRWSIGVAALLVVFFAIAAWKAGELGMLFAKRAERSDALTNAVAVLPVESEDLNDDDTWMRLGLMDLIASRLRNAGVVVVPSSDIVSLEQGGPHGAALAVEVREAVGVPNVVAPQLARDASGWVLRAALLGRDATARNVEAHSADAIGAAREISDKLLTLLGKHPETDGTSRTAPYVTELQQRVEAAWLAGNVSRAQHILEAAPADVKAMPEVQLLAARIDLAGGDAATVEERLQEMLADLSPEANPLLRAGILTELGAAERQTQKWDLARQRFDESVRLLDDLNQPLLLGRAYVGRAAIGSLQGRYDDAQADFSHARIAFELAGDSLEVARTEANEGVLEGMRAHPSEALSLLSHAADGLDRFGDRSWLVNALANMISAQLDLLRPGDAFATSERMNRDIGETGSSVHARMARLQQLPALLDSGHVKDARNLLADLQQIEGIQEDRGFLGALNGYQARLAYDDEQWQAALDGAEKAVAQLTDVEDEDARGSAWLIQIRALRGLHREQDAALEVQKLSAWSRERETPRRTLRADLAEAEQASAEHNLQPAYELYEIALHIAHERGVPADVAAVAVSYGNVLLTAGELSRAATVVGQVTPWARDDFHCALLQARLYQKLGRDELWRAALDQARALAVERSIPADIAERPPQ